MFNRPKILIIYVNHIADGGDQPVGIASLATVLKNNNYNYDFCDTSFLISVPLGRGQFAGHLKTDGDSSGEPETYDNNAIIDNMLSAYNIAAYKLILISAMTATFGIAENILQKIKQKNPDAMTIMGGIQPTVQPEETIASEYIDAICIGEGEEALLEFLDLFSSGQSFTETKNFWFKINNKLIKNPLRNYLDVNQLPNPDYSIFKEEHFYRPFAGKIYRTISVEISRGCPFDCSYCINRHLKKIYGVRAKHHRQMTVNNAISRLEYIKEVYKPEFFRFIDESFTIVNTQYLRELSEKYREIINLPFWIQTSAVTLNEEKVRLLKEMNCAAVSIGAEHGDEHFRKTVLKKKVPDKQLYKAMELLEKYDIRRSAYFMVGLPFENRALAFKSIEMYKNFLHKYGAAPSGIACFYPFPGTELYDVCLENNFISSKADPEKALYWPALDMPDFTYNEIIGIKRTFFAYSVMDEKLYPLIEACEEPSQCTDKMLNIISEIYAK